MRPGCVCLTVTALLSAAELERLEGAHPSRLAAAVAAAVAQAASSATPSGRKLLVGWLAAASVLFSSVVRVGETSRAADSWGCCCYP